MTDTLSNTTNCCQTSTGTACSPVESAYRPRFDIQETDEALVLYGDLPGVLPEDLDIRYENGELTVHAKVTPRNASARAVRREYGVGDFQRTFSVSEPIDADAIKATLRHGVLTLHLPKAEAAKPRRIQVQA